MSHAKLAKLELMIDLLERQVGASPDLCTLYQLPNSEPDLERFEREYGATPDELAARGSMIVERINFRDALQSVVSAKCTTCHTPSIVGVDTLLAGDLDLRMDAVVDTMENATFPRAYISLAGGEVDGMMETDVVTPGFSRRSRLIDWLMAVGSRSGQPAHPEGPNALTAAEVRQFRVWVDLGAQYK